MLCDYIDIYGDGIHGTPNYDVHGEYFFVNGNNLEDGKIIINDGTLKITKEEAERIRRPLCNRTILISINGTLGRIALYNNEKVSLGKSACFLNVKEGISRIFIKYVLTSELFSKYAYKVASGATIKNLAPSQVAEYEFIAPEVKYWNGIAKVLSTIDAKIANNNAICAELEAMAKQIYDYWFVQFDFPDKNGKPYKSSGGKMVYNQMLKREIPEGWEVGNLYDLAYFKNGLACQNFRPYNNEHKLPVVKIREMHHGFSADTEFVQDDISEDNIINNGDILFAWSASLEVMLWIGGKAGLNQHIFKVIPKNKNKYYVYFLLKQYIINFIKMAEARKTTMGHITTDHLQQSKILIPSKKIAEKFENNVTIIFNKIVVTKTETQQLTALRDFLLPMLMNGQVEVKA